MTRDTIEIVGLRLDCIVGVRPDEREREQPVRLDLVLGLDLVRAGHSGRIRDTCDYDRVARQLVALLRFRRYRLVEAAAEELAAMLFGGYPMVEQVWIRIEKPMALEGRARGAAVSIRRERGDFPCRRERTRFGEVEILLESREAGLYLLHVDPSQEITPPPHRVVRELEWLAAGVLLRDGQALPTAEPWLWPQGHGHSYLNPGPDSALLFRCHCPPCIHEDETLPGGPGPGDDRPG